MYRFKRFRTDPSQPLVRMPKIWNTYPPQSKSSIIATSPSKCLLLRSNGIITKIKTKTLFLPPYNTDNIKIKKPIKNVDIDDLSIICLFNSISPKDEMSIISY
jgi:hypothetical protein